MPLQYNKSRDVIIAVSSPNRLLEELKAYNIDPASPGLHVVLSPTDLPDVLELPPETPWTILGGTGVGAVEALSKRFGPSVIFPNLIGAYEVDLAWRRDKIPTTLFAPTYDQPPEPAGPFPHTPHLPVPDGYNAIVTQGNALVISAGNAYVVVKQ